MTIKERLDQLKRPVTEVFEEYMQKMPYKLSAEVGIKHPDNQSCVHLRDDNIIEISAGKAGILIDGNTGTISIFGNSVLFDTMSIDEHLGGRHLINGKILNDLWYNSNDLAWILTPSSKEVFEQPMILVGAPASLEQYSVPLSALLTPRRLFVHEHSNGEFSKLVGVLGDGTK